MHRPNVQFHLMGRPHRNEVKGSASLDWLGQYIKQHIDNLLGIFGYFVFEQAEQAVRKDLAVQL